MFACIKQVRKYPQIFVFYLSVLLYSGAVSGDTLITASSAQSTLIFGILPAQSAVSLFNRFAPLREYLHHELQRDVSIETAKNFSEFIERTAQRQYDIVFTAPHFALKAIERGNYEVAVTLVKPLSAVVIVAQSSPITSIEQLAGKTIAVPPQQAIITLVGQQFLKDRGLLESRQPVYKAFRTHNAASSAALGGDADAAIISNYIFFKQKSQGVAIRKVAETPGFPGIGILVANDLDDNLKEQIKNSLINMQHYPEGLAVLKQISQPGYKESSANEFEKLRPYVDVLKVQ